MDSTGVTTIVGERKRRSCRADINAKDYSGVTPLHLASKQGHLVVVKQFVGLGAEINAMDKDGQTPLHLSCSNGHLAVVKELLEGGAGFRLANNLGKLPIHQAVSGRKSVVVKYLLQKFYAETFDQDGRLPLHALLEDLTFKCSSDFSVPPLLLALEENVLGTGCCLGDH
jgi:ankyrin repeat protein